MGLSIVCQSLDVKFAACQEPTLLAGEVWVASDVPSTEAVDEGESKTNYFSKGLSNQVYWQITVWSRTDPYFRKLVLHFTGVIYKDDDHICIIGMDNNSFHSIMLDTVKGIEDQSSNNKIATTPTHIAHCFTKQFTNTVKHATHKTNRHINRATHNIQGYNITLTTSQVQETIKQSKNNNSQGPDKLNIRHLKHRGPLGLAFLTSMFKTALNKNIIPHTWTLANIVPIPKPNKDTDKGTSYRPISLLPVIANTLEKSLLPYITENIPNTPMQHGYKTQHSTVTALHTLNNTVAKGFNQMANNHCSTRYEQSFRHNKHTHTNQKAATDKHSRHNH